MNTINKENSSSLNSEDNKTEKDFNLEKMNELKIGPQLMENN
jgi:hypothetical protein